MARTKIDKALLDLSGVLASSGGTLTGSITFNPSTDGIVGTATNNNATAGNVGEYVVSTVSSVGITGSGVLQNVTSLALTAGDWDVCGFAVISNPGATVGGPNNMYIGTSSTQVDEVISLNWFWLPPVNTAFAVGGSTSPVRISLASPSTCYLAVGATYSSTAPSTWATIRARRIR